MYDTDGSWQRGEGSGDRRQAGAFHVASPSIRVYRALEPGKKATAEADRGAAVDGGKTASYATRDVSNVSGPPSSRFPPAVSLLCVHPDKRKEAASCGRDLK